MKLIPERRPEFNAFAHSMATPSRVELIGRAVAANNHAGFVALVATAVECWEALSPEARAELKKANG